MGLLAPRYLEENRAKATRIKQHYTNPGQVPLQHIQYHSEGTTTL